MSAVTSYSDARRELERITSQRKHFFNNSKSLQDENMSNLKQDHSRFSTPSSSNRPFSVPIDYQTNYRTSSSSPMKKLNSSGQSTDKMNNLNTSHKKIHQKDVSSNLGLGSASSVIGAFRQLQVLCSSNSLNLTISQFLSRLYHNHIHNHI
jgi:ribosomal protein S15P/S13E